MKTLRINKKIAFRRLAESAKFKIWHTRKVHEVITNMTIEQSIEKQMQLENIKIEVHDENGRWIEIQAESIGDINGQEVQRILRSVMDILKCKDDELRTESK